jgi:hypothetical protein
MTNAAGSPLRVRWFAHLAAVAAALVVVYSFALAQKDNHAATFFDRSLYHRFSHFGFPLVALDVHEKGDRTNQATISHEPSLRYPAAIANILLALLLAGSTWWLVLRLSAALDRPRFSLGTLLVLTGGVAIFLAGATQSPAWTERFGLELARSWPPDFARWMPKWPLVLGFAATSIAASALVVAVVSWAYARLTGLRSSR